MPEALIKKAFDLHCWINENLNCIEVPNEKRVLYSVFCYDVVIEHHIGIIHLLHSRIFGSAFALVRPLFETFIRGAWLRNCATDKEIEKYESDRIDKTFTKLVDEVEKIEGFQGGVLGKLKTNSWNAMNSYTHGGMSQASRRFTGSFIEPNFSEEEIVEVIKISGTFALFSFHLISKEAKNEDLAKKAIEMLDGLG